MLKRYALLVIAVVVVNTMVYSSGKDFIKDNLQLETRLHYGFLMTHHLELEKFNSHFPSFELSLQKQTFGTHRWEKEYDYPIVGLSFWGSGIGGFKEIGNGYALLPFINFPLFRNNKSTFNFRLGIGLGYLENMFDNKNNYKNFAIGSHLNMAANLQFEYRLALSERFVFSSGFTLMHFSNGSTKTPNYGLNMLMGSVSMAYFLKPPRRYGGRMILPELYPFEFDGRKYLEVNFTFTIANKDMTQSLGERFMVYAFYSTLAKRVSYKSKFGIGLDITSDFSDKYLLELNATEEDNYSSTAFVKTGLNASYELLISRMSFLFHLGIYVGGKYRKRGDAYQRLALKYLLTRDLSAALTLSTHAGVADYIGLSLGYRFRFIYKRDIKH